MVRGVQTVVVGAVVVAAALAGLGVGVLSRGSPATSVSRPVEMATATIDVHVGGWVVSPGVVSVPVGSITAAVIDLAGGLIPGAAVDQINLAAEVFAGEQILVPGPDLAGESPNTDGALGLNQASANDLETLPGVGPVLAERIVAYREANGRFNSVEDLLDVPGIGESKLASIRDLVRP